MTERKKLFITAREAYLLLKNGNLRYVRPYSSRDINKNDEVEVVETSSAGEPTGQNFIGRIFYTAETWEADVFFVEFLSYAPADETLNLEASA